MVLRDRLQQKVPPDGVGFDLDRSNASSGIALSVKGGLVNLSLIDIDAIDGHLCESREPTSFAPCLSECLVKYGSPWSNRTDSEAE